MSSWSRWLMVAAAASPLAWLCPPLRHFAESRMAVHMLVQLPMLFFAGWGLAPLVPERWLKRWATVDEMGLTGVAIASAVSAFWMIPAALDQALLLPQMDLAKYLSWLLAGVALKAGWRRITSEVLLFLVGSSAWLLATAGFLYFDADSRLCVNYRVDEQQLTGLGLIAWALALPALSLLRMTRSREAGIRPNAHVPSTGDF